MKNKDIEKMLFSAFADAVPDKADDIIKKAASKRNPGALMSVDQVDRRQRYLHYAAMAAAALVLIVGVTLAVSLIRSREAAGTVTVEGAECYEIELNRDNRPLSVSGRDSAAKQTARLIGNDYNTLDEAVDRILDTMLEAGSLNDDCNTVLITVSLDEKPELQLDIAVDAARQSFDEAGFNGAVLGTVAKNDKEVLNISRRNTVSVGKAEMVRDILAADGSFNAAALCRLPINELNLISVYRRIQYASISVRGTSHGCISPENAAELALTYMDTPGADANAVLRCDDAGLYYAVTVMRWDGAYTCRLSAVTGEMLADDTLTASEPQTGPDRTATDPTASVTQHPAAVSGSPTEQVPPTATPQPTSVPRPTGSPTTPPKPTEAPSTKPTTTPKPTDAPRPTPTEPEPDIFTRSMYYRCTSGVQTADILPATASKVTLRRVSSGYDVYYTDETFPYSAKGVQGGITALVFNTAQFRSLTGTDDSRFSDEYFRTHVLYVYMNRDAEYHYTKSLTAAYMDAGTLYMENAEQIGRYVGDQETKIHTVIYELNKDDLRSFTNMIEFE